MVMTERVRTELMSGREVVASGRYPYTGRLGILSPEDWEKVDEAIALVHAKEVQEQDFMKAASDACARHCAGHEDSCAG